MLVLSKQAIDITMHAIFFILYVLTVVIVIHKYEYKGELKIKVKGIRSFNRYYSSFFSER